MEEKKKYAWADNLRVAATLGVIAVHASASIPPLFGQIPLSIWWTGNILDSLARFCVPVFVMLSGALLLRSYSPPTGFFRKRFLRIVFPFLFWCLTYSLLQLAVKTGELWKMSSSEYLGLFWRQLVEDSISYHFWYVYMILGLYILVPFIGGFIRRASDGSLLWFAALWFSLIFYADAVDGDMKVPDVLRYFGYLPLGYYLGKKDLKQNDRLVSVILTLSGFAITSIGTYWLSEHTEKFNPLLYGYASPAILLFSVGVFMLFRSFERPLPDRLAFINRYSYGIYLVHVLVLSQIKLPWLISYPLIGIPLTVTICLLVSALVVFFINKLPGGKYISG